MGEKENIVAIIPARGGSKGIPRKNLKLLNNKPLIVYAIESALKTKGINRVIVSTEDEEIAKVSKQYGAEVPFMRPLDLAGDKVLTVPVLKNAVKWLRENENYDIDIVVLMYPTSPLLKPETITSAIQKIEGNPGVDSVLSLVRDDKYHWKETNGRLERVHPKKIMRRQDMQPCLRENGALYIVRRKILEDQDSYVGGKIDFVLMGETETWDIDTLEDWEMVETIILRKEKARNTVQN